MLVKEFEAEINRLTARDIEVLDKWLEEGTGSGPWYDHASAKSLNMRRVTYWAKGKPDRIALVLARVKLMLAESGQAKQSAQSAFSQKKDWIKRYLPEAEAVLTASGGNKPQKFYEALRIQVTPSTFNPSAQGDFAFTHSFTYDGRQLISGPGFSYDSMINVGVKPVERGVDVPPGVRVWVVTYDGQWGGYWSRVVVYMHPQALPPGGNLLT